MNILVINAGSSSLKYQLFNMQNESVLAKGVCERIGMVGSNFMYENNKGNNKEYKQAIGDHKQAVSLLMLTLTDDEVGIIDSMGEIDAIGHRISHGGEECTESFLINDETIKIIEKNIELAPLHNPANLVGVKACLDAMPGVPMVGMPDTAFHHTIPKHAYMYPLPYEYYEKYRVRKYGFHGMSHKYVSERAANYLSKSYKSLKIISCHLGNGSSITAIKNGKSIENTMGFTPLDGITMGTRSGAIDPAIVLYLLDKENKSTNEINDVLNKKSGMLGLSGISSDFRDLGEECRNGNEKAQLAIDVYSYKIKKCIGEYAAVLGGLDVLIFTAGIGENDYGVRSKAVEGLEFIGVEIDLEKNRVGKDCIDISSDSAKVKTLVIQTNEEIVIARETVKIIQNLQD